MPPETFSPNCAATAIGSFPYRDAKTALDVIFAALPEIPTWPQLPARALREGFYAQYAFAIPGIRFDEEKKSVYVDTGDDSLAELERFYENVLAENLEAFAFPPDFAEGFAPFVDRIAALADKPLALKGHITGPISFGLGLTDENKKVIVYNDTYFEAVRHAIRLHAIWQADQLARFGTPVILFIDEPLLMNFGSAFNQLTREQAIEWLREIVDPLHERGVLAGVHCCGNTDWSLLFESGVDIVNFDGWEFFHTLNIYAAAMRGFLDRGGILACGIVPTVEEELDIEPGRLTELFDERLRDLDAGRPVEQTLRQTLVTPACGLGTVGEAYPEKALRLAAEVSARTREKYGL